MADNVHLWEGWVAGRPLREILHGQLPPLLVSRRPPAPAPLSCGERRGRLLERRPGPYAVAGSRFITRTERDIDTCTGKRRLVEDASRDRKALADFHGDVLTRSRTLMITTAAAQVARRYESFRLPPRPPNNAGAAGGSRTQPAPQGGLTGVTGRTVDLRRAASREVEVSAKRIRFVQSIRARPGGASRRLVSPSSSCQRSVLD